MLNLLLTTTRLASRPLLHLPRSTASLLPPSTRLLSSTPNFLAPTSSAPGSGQGGKADKAKAAKDKAAAAKQRDKDRAARDKAREVRDKEKERAAKVKAKEKAAKEKEKEKLAKEKAKAKEVAAKAKKTITKASTKSVFHPPKAPQNAWQIFAAEFIAERKASAAPGTKLPSAAALSAEAAPLYRALDPATKASLVAKADAQRAAYPAILAAYTASLSPALIKEENAIRSRRRRAGLSNRRNLKIPGAPKRPLTGFMAFVGDVRRDRPEVIEGVSNVLEQSKAIAQEWKALTEEQRQEYTASAVKTREAYVAELAEFEKKLAETE